ncbi:DUF488 domain-containing protein [Acetobacter sp.]|uniref:DUF488 domain-containing protein n=1 Tax=Acetobacter sp. TaxID=440 RepID=UPI0039E73A6C
MFIIHVKRVYDPASDDDGARLLVDRLWPRGESKEKAALTEWVKDAAPSTGLRVWFGHDPVKWEEFRKRYCAELDNRSEVIARLLDYARRGPITLLVGARDTEHNEAVVLADYLREKLK